MRRIINLGILLLGGFAANATAGNCTGDTSAVLQVDPNTVLDGMRVIAVAGSGGEEWKEDHCLGGDLYKVGTTDGPPKHPERPSVDPYAKVGTWSGAGGVLNYIYTGGPGSSSGPFELWLATSDTYYFCQTGTSTTEVAHTTAPLTSASPCTGPTQP